MKKINKLSKHVILDSVITPTWTDKDPVTKLPNIEFPKLKMILGIQIVVFLKVLIGMDLFK